jgi:predicted Zn-dependent protease
MVASTLLSFALGFAGIPVPITATDVATTSVTRSFSRDDEREADQLGVEFMANADYDSWGAMRLQEKLLKVADSSMLPFLSTHPSSAERVENMKRLAMETSPDQAPAQTPVGSLEKIQTLTLPAMRE